jgi:outer membrane protein insertion porin family
VRRVAIAILLTAGAVGTAHAQTPYPVPVQEEPKPTPVPVEGGPRPVPVPVEEGPKPSPSPAPGREENPNQPVPIQQQPAPQQPAPNQQPNQQQPNQQQPNQPKPTPAPAPAPPPPAPAQPPPPDLKLQKRADLPPEQINPPLSSTLTGTAEIKKIIVEDNKKTDDDTVEAIADIEVGDSWDAGMIDVVKQRLVSSGLFKDVEVFWTMVPGGVAVHILAKDKHSWVIAPAFYNQPTNVGGGIGFGENNLFGQNQKLLLYGQVATGDTFFIGAWLVPAIAQTRFSFQLDTYLKSGRNIEYTSPTSWLVEEGEVRPVRESRIHYFNVGGNLGVELIRGLRLQTRLRAAKVSYKDIKLAEGAMLSDVDPALTDPTLIPAPGKEGADISNEWSLTLDRRANWYGVQEGKKIGVSLEHSLGSWGSDFEYWLMSVNGMRAYKVLARHNLILKAVVNYGHNLPFQQEFQTGGTSMRGWLNNQFRGDLRVLGNFEYSVPMFTIYGFSVRGLAFFDSAYTTFLKTTQNTMDGTRHYLPNPQVRGLDGFKNSVGVGTRFYLRQIVLPLLGLDFGYGLEARDYQIYLAIGLTD